MFAIEGPRTTRHRATIADARRRRIARQFRKLQRRRKALLDRTFLVARDRFKPRTPAGVLLRHFPPTLVLLYRTLLRHSYLLAVPLFRATLYWRNGKLNA